VGYNDIGNMKDIANDNTPSWQEVAALNIPDSPALEDPIYRLFWTDWGYRTDIDVEEFLDRADKSIQARSKIV
jgi:hypothetical protein